MHRLQREHVQKKSNMHTTQPWTCSFTHSCLRTHTPHPLYPPSSHYPPPPHHITHTHSITPHACTKYTCTPPPHHAYPATPHTCAHTQTPSYYAHTPHNATHTQTQTLTSARVFLPRNATHTQTNTYFCQSTSSPQCYTHTHNQTLTSAKVFPTVQHTHTHLICQNTSSPQCYTHTHKCLHVLEYVFPTTLHTHKQTLTSARVCLPHNATPHTHTQTLTSARVCRRRGSSGFCSGAGWTGVGGGICCAGATVTYNTKFYYKTHPVKLWSTNFLHVGVTVWPEIKNLNIFFITFYFTLLEVRGQSPSHCLGTISCLCHLMAFLTKSVWLQARWNLSLSIFLSNKDFVHEGHQMVRSLSLNPLGPRPPTLFPYHKTPDHPVAAG